MTRRLTTWEIMLVTLGFYTASFLLSFFATRGAVAFFSGMGRRKARKRDYIPEGDFGKEGQ
jgi:hypothetical protein